jgi:hypothetical protein
MTKACRPALSIACVLLLVFGPFVGRSRADAAESVGRAPLGLSATAEARVATSDLRRAVSPQTTASPADSSPQKPFFKTGRGIAAAVLMAGGLGWLVYSHSHDRVKSPGNTGY